MRYKVILQSGEIQYPECIGKVQTMGHDVYALTEDGKILAWAETLPDDIQVWKELPEELSEPILSYFEEQRLIAMDERIEAYLRGQMTEEEEHHFLFECKNNKELKDRATMIALLTKALK